MMLVAICTPICFFLMLMMRVKFGRWLSYANVVNCLWLIGIVTTSLGAFDVYQPCWKVYLYIMLMLISFNTLTFFCVRNSKIQSDELTLVCISPTRNKIETVLLLFLLMLMIPELINSLKVLLLGGYNLVRENSLTSFTFIQYFLYHYGNPIIISLSVISIVDVVFTGKNKLNFALAFVDTVINITIFASRWMLLEFILLLVLCLVLKYRFRILNIIKNNRKLMVCAVAGVCIVLFITSQRKMSGGNTTILENVFFYIWGSIACMGGHLSSIESSIAQDGYTFGQMFFSGIVGFFDDILQPLLHISITPGIETLNKIVQNFVFVSPNVRMNNNVTMVTAFLVDGGGFGVVILTAITAWILAHLYNKMNEKRSEKYTAYFIFSFSLFLFGIIEWMPARATNIWVFIIIALIYKVRKIKINFKSRGGML